MATSSLLSSSVGLSLLEKGYSSVLTGMTLFQSYPVSIIRWTGETRLTSVGLGGIALPTSNYTLFESEEAF